jgi:hypothetical protein
VRSLVTLTRSHKCRYALVQVSRRLIFTSVFRPGLRTQETDDHVAHQKNRWNPRSKCQISVNLTEVDSSHDARSHHNVADRQDPV